MHKSLSLLFCKVHKIVWSYKLTVVLYFIISCCTLVLKSLPCALVDGVGFSSLQSAMHSHVVWTQLTHRIVLQDSVFNVHWKTNNFLILDWYVTWCLDVELPQWMVEYKHSVSKHNHCKVFCVIILKFDVLFYYFCISYQFSCLSADAEKGVSSLSKSFCFLSCIYDSKASLQILWVDCFILIFPC